MKKYIVLLLFVCFQNTFSQTSNERTVVLDSVVITSSKYEKNINELPYSSVVIKSQQITNSTSQSVSDLLKRESGLALIRDGIWGTEVNIRGMSRSNIVTLIDGNRIETSTDVSARLSMIDVNDIDKIEVIKGAVSTLYGTGATGGIVNIISKKEKYSDIFFTRGSISSGYNSVNNNFLSGITLSAGAEKWTAKISGSFRKADNTKTPAGALFNSQFKDNSINGFVSVKPFANHELLLDYQQFNAEDVGIPGAYSVFPSNAKVSYPEERRKMISSEYIINNISTLVRKISAKYYHQYIYRDVENIPNQIKLIPAANGQPAKRVSVLEINPTAKHNTNGFQLQSDFLLGERHYVISGLDYWERKYNGERVNSQKIEVLNSDGSLVLKTSNKKSFEKPLPNADYSSTGFFIQDEMRLIEKKLNLTLGGRFDLINISNDETKNPQYEITDGVINNNPSNQTIIWKANKAKNTSYTFNLGLLYSLSEHSNISFSSARSFRSPSLEERYQYIDQGNILRLGNPQLNPEKGYSFELGYRLNHNIIKLKASTFYNYFKDLVTEIPSTYQTRDAYIKVNIGKASLYGFEVESDFNLMPSLMFYTSLSYVRGMNIKENTNLPQITPLNGISGFNLSILKFVNADFSATYFAKQNRIAPGEINTSGYVVFDLNLNSSQLNFGFVGIKLSAGIENLFNKEYRNHLSTNRGLIICEPGRNFYFKTNINW